MRFLVCVFWENRIGEKDYNLSGLDFFEVVLVYKKIFYEKGDFPLNFVEFPVEVCLIQTTVGTILK